MTNHKEEYTEVEEAAPNSQDLPDADWYVIDPS